ncbi:EmrB/QacA subfamily drug resistance transporter [Catenulispora sp. EB89]|uniref:MFS transporter n=1 Tax=Catenulispora sp. EB89 TaxID=3156257 RepID=UPI003519583A
MSGAVNTSTAPPPGSFLATRRGKVTLALLCAVTFLDVMDGAIVNVALPTIRTHLGFSVQNLQWVVSGYLITYGGFLLLGGRAADLLGRRRLLVAGTVLFAASSLACGLADDQGLLVGARLAQGFGAAMMSPAALSILTTTFQGADRHKALGLWAGISGMASAVGLLVGGVLTQEFGWRWVFFVSVPICALVLFGAFRILEDDHSRSVASSAPGRAPSGFDAVGALLATAGMLLLIFTVVKAPDAGWSAGRTIGGLAASAMLMAAFVVNEQRRAHPLVPLSIFRIRGLAAADATQVIAWAGFYSMFFFVTLYMQNVLGYSQLRSGLAYVPVSVGIGFGSTLATKMFIRTGTRPIIVSGALLAAGGILWLSRIPVDGTYLGNLLTPLVVMGLGLGLLYAGVQTAANAGVPADQAGLAAALITASFQLGSALGLAVFSGIATSRTSHLLAAHASAPAALTGGFQRALLVSALCLVAAGVIALRASNTRGEFAAPTESRQNLEPSYDAA